MGSKTATGGAQNGNEVVNGMPSFVSQIPTSASASKPIVKEGETIHTSQISNFGVLEQSLGFRIEDTVDLSKHPIFNAFKASSQGIGPDVQLGALNKSVAPSDISAAILASQILPAQKESQQNLISPPGGYRENWAESNMADNSPLTDTSTDGDTDDKNQRLDRDQLVAVAASDSSDRSKEKPGDQKTLRSTSGSRGG